MQDRPPRTLTASLFVADLFDQNTLAHPLASPELASYGAPSEVLEELSLFLHEHVERAAPDAIARLVFPEGTRLHEVAVTLPPDDLPRRLAREVTITIPCAVIEDGTPDESGKERGAWVMIPALDHTAYVAAGEDIDEVVQREVRRLVVAHELSTIEQLALFPARAHAIVPMTITLPDRAAIAGGRSARKKLAEKAKQIEAAEVLASIGARVLPDKRSAPITGRDDELDALSVLLEGRERLSVALIGPEDVGKSALVRAFAARSKRPVFATSGAQLLAGMSGLGEWQERVREVMEAARDIDAIVYFDSFEDLLTERVESGGADLPSAIRPWIEQGLVRVLGEIRPESLDALESRSYAFAAALARVRVSAMSPAQALAVIERIAAHDAGSDADKPALDGPPVVHEALPALIDLAHRYLPYGSFPGKAVRLYDDLRGARSFSGSPSPSPISSRELYQLFSRLTGVPELILREDAPLRVGDVAKYLSDRVIGQERAVRALAETIAIVKAGLQPENKPLATFLFVGPTGVGKTELARALAELLFGSKDRLIRFDMSEYATPDASFRLIRGEGRADGLLTRKIREQPFSVVLLDEIEKAHPSVFDLLLQVTGEGRLTNARGKTAHFQNAIVIMTSNLGATSKEQGVGFGAGERGIDARYTEIVAETFRPELVNRIDRVIPFAALQREEIELVTRLAIDKLRERRGVEQAGVSLAVSDRAIARVAEDGYSAIYGARALRRHVEERIGAPVARLLASLGEERELWVHVTVAGESVHRGGSGLVSADVEGVIAARAEVGPLAIEVRRKKSVKAAHQVFEFDRIAGLRRDVDAWMVLPNVEQISDQVDLTIAQLATGGQGDDVRFRREVGELHAEHHRLTTILASLREPAEELAAIEELALFGLLSGEDVTELAGDAEAAFGLVRDALPHALVALYPTRDEVTLIVEERDKGAMITHVEPMLREIKRRRWSAISHLAGDRAGASDEPWPIERPWGPPRAIDYAIAAILGEKPPRSLLLRCKGTDAGAFLALEAGVHRLPMSSRVAGSDRVGHVLVRVVAMRFEVPDEAWTKDDLAPWTEPLDRGVIARDVVDGVVWIANKRASVRIDKRDYWSMLDAIACAHLLLFEGGALDRDEALPEPDVEEDA